MQVSFLPDENIAAPQADKLDKAGHDVERIVDVSELGEGIDDTTICQSAVREGRLIVTIPATICGMRVVDRRFHHEAERRLGCLIIAGSSPKPSVK